MASLAVAELGVPPDSAWHGPPVGHDEARELEIIAQDIGQKLAVLGAIGSAHRIVGRHDARHAAVPDDHLEVSRIDFAQGLLVHGGILRRALVLDVVGGIVFGAGWDVVLNTGNQGCAQSAELEGILSIGLLCPPPKGMAQDIDGRRQHHGLTGRNHLVADGQAYLVFEIRVPGRSAGHGHGEHGGLAVHGAGRLDGSVQVDPTRAIAKGEPFD